MAISLPIVSKFDDKGVNGAEKAIGKLQGTLKTFAGIAIAAFSVDAIVDFGKSALRAAEDAAVANNRLDAIAKSMGLFGNQTDKVTDRIKAFADTMALKVGVDDEAIKAAQAQLLTFKNLAISADTAGGAFDRATIAVADLAAAGLGSLDTSAIQLGKALQDPIKGIAALSRAGVTFTADQKQFIQSLVDSNQMLEAQNYILDAIETQVGGTAEATVTAAEKMEIAIGEIQESVGQLLAPAFEDFANWLVKNLPGIQKYFEDLGNNLGTIFTNIGNFWNSEVVSYLRKWWEEDGPKFKEAWEAIKPAIDTFSNNVLPLVIGIFAVLWSMVRDNVLTALNNFAEFLDDPNNKNTIMFFTGLILALSAQFFTLPIVISAIAVAITWLITVLQEAIKAWNRFWDAANPFKNGPPAGSTDPRNRFNPNVSNWPGQAKGGYTAQPGFSWVGEKGPELLSLPKGATVTPIPQHMRADQMMGANSGGGANVTYAINVNAGMGTNGTQVGQEIIKAISQFERGNGRVFARA